MNKLKNIPAILPCAAKAQDYLENQGDPSKAFKYFEKMLFGVELECNVTSDLFKMFIETGRDTRQQVVNIIFPTIKDIAIIKFEAVPYGFEVASAPGTFEWHQTAWNSFFDLTETIPSLLEVKSEGCGMHIHMSKEGFKDDFHISRMGYFIHREENRDFIKMIGGRPCHFVNFSTPSGFDKKEDNIRSAFHGQTSHNTVEARFFQSTLVKEEFFKNLEFMHVLTRFTRPAVGKEHKEKLTVDNFKEFLAEGNRKNLYPNLWNFLNPDDKITGSEDIEPSEIDDTPAMVKRDGPVAETTV